MDTPTSPQNAREITRILNMLPAAVRNYENGPAGQEKSLLFFQGLRQMPRQPAPPAAQTLENKALQGKWAVPQGGFH